MVLSNFQFLWNGLTFGAGTDIQLVKEEGLRSLPQVRSGDIVRPRMDGYYAGFQYLNERISVLTLAITVTSAPFETVVANVAAAFQPNSDPSALSVLQFMYPGFANPRQVYGRVTRAGFITDLDYSFHKISSLPVEFTCSNPLIYDSVATSTSVALATSGTFPLTTLTAGALVGDTTLTVASNSGFVPGQTVYVDTAGTETRIVSSISGATSVTITVGLTSAHSSGAAVSGSTFPVNLVLTSLSASVTAGGTSLTVSSSAGFYAGQTVFLDLSGTETLIVASIPDATHVTLVTGPTSGHASGAFLWNGMGFAPTTGGAILTTNIGNYKTLPVFTIQGPVVNPLLTLTSTNEFFGLTTTLSASDSMVVDMQAGTVILNGTATRYNLVVPGSTWFGLPPGGGNVKVSSSDSTYPIGNSFRADYRSAWSWT